MRLHFLRSSRLFPVFAVLFAGLPADGAEIKGQRIFICGHSFHVPIVKPLEEAAKAAGITDQKLIGSQFLGGSQVIKHWNQPDEKDKVKRRSGPEKWIS